ncbi:MAG TPA: class I SAM-dependent methyltransferase [Verrucomicrobiae bacterium]|nr:class I SAM-dependent methyltransferase [Verrucomicrobiae bacterium]
MKAYSPKEYWAGLADNFHSADTAGFAPILHPGAPAWFNSRIDHLQFCAMRRALALAEVSRPARILDVGCGTGRWLRRYCDLGFDATGIDATPQMLRLARGRGTMAPLVTGEANRLPFRSAEFDVVSDVTVIQHIPAARQEQALLEMTRVLKPGGRMILFELIRGEDLHIFPRNPQSWMDLGASCGLRARGWFGQEYLLLDRLFVRVARGVMKRRETSVATGVDSAETMSSRATILRRVYWELRHGIVPLSAWAEPIVGRLCPGRLATHGVFVFQK